MEFTQEYPPVIETHTELPKPPPEEGRLPETGVEALAILVVAVILIALGTWMRKTRW